MDLILWIVALIASVVIAQIYFRRTGKALSFYLLLDDQPLSRVDQDVRKRLSINFSYPVAPDGANSQPESRSTEVKDLHHVQVVIYNNGVKAVTFTEAPTIEIPLSANILDASVIYQKPEDLEAAVARLPVADGKDQTVRIALRMLNRSEFVVVKFLLSQAIDAKALKLHLLAEDLDRNIKIKHLPADATKSRFEATDFAAITVGVFCILCGAATADLASAMLSKSPLPSISKLGLVGFFQQLSVDNCASLFSFISVVLLGLFGAALVYGIGIQPILLRDRVVLPKDLRPRS